MQKLESILFKDDLFFFLVKGQENGVDSFFYVVLRGSMMDNFIRHMHLPKFNISKHALVLESGKGEPSKEIKDKMFRKFGFVE